MDDHALAAEAARRAAELLLELRARGGTGAQGDRQADDVIIPFLREQRPDDAVLSEESKDDLVRLDAKRVWIVDPLDGTREFGESGRNDWAVHVALVIDGRVEAAAVALPALHATLTTDPAPPFPPAHDGPPRLVVSRSRPPAIASALAYHLGGEMLALGSAGAKAMAVVLGYADVYAHSGGQYEWDSAAPVGVAASAGLHASRLDGSPIEYNRPDPWLPDLLVCRPELAEPILEVTSRLGPGERWL